MTISAQLYRVRIGHFIPLKIHETKFKGNPTNMTSNLVPRILFLLMLSALPLLTFHFLIPYAPENHHLVGPKTKESLLSVRTNIFCRARLGISGNRIQKIINGNRRAIGFKLAAWNCGTGLLNETFSHKLHEIKQFMTSRKPHCFGIIESDLYSH